MNRNQLVIWTAIVGIIGSIFLYLEWNHLSTNTKAILFLLLVVTIIIMYSNIGYEVVKDKIN